MASVTAAEVRCDSLGSAVSTPRTLTDPAEAEAEARRKRSGGPGLATKRAEMLQTRRIKPNRNVGSRLKVSWWSWNIELGTTAAESLHSCKLNQSGPVPQSAQSHVSLC